MRKLLMRMSTKRWVYSRSFCDHPIYEEYFNSVRGGHHIVSLASGIIVVYPAKSINCNQRCVQNLTLALISDTPPIPTGQIPLPMAQCMYLSSCSIPHVEFWRQTFRCCRSVIRQEPRGSMLRLCFPMTSGTSGHNISKLMPRPRRCLCKSRSSQCHTGSSRSLLP